MKNLLASFILLTALSFGSISPLFSQNFQEIYQNALIKEEGEGALLEAISIYNQIVDAKNADEILKAKALLHVGFCYEKLGRDEATKAYRRLVDNFPGQKSEVAMARERLSRLIAFNQKQAEESKNLKKTMINKKIWDENETDLEGAVSPDGRFLSYVDWETGDLALFEIASGKKRRLTNKGSWEESTTYCEYSRWFPNSKKIIYLWYHGEEMFAELRTININDPEPKILLKDTTMEWAEIYDCSSNGEFVLACLDRKNDEGILTLITTNDGSERALRPHYTTNAAFSSDQRFVIYDLPQEDENGNKDIYIMELDTKNESKLIEHPGDDRLMGRVPNEDNILFVSDRTGTPDFWSVKVQNGKSLFEAELVKSNMGPFPPISLGFTNGGAFFYGQQRNDNNVYETEIEPLTGEIISGPTRIIQKYIGANACPDYSPDGKYLAYVSRRPPGTMIFTTNPVGNVLRICSLETNEEKEFRPDINVFGWPKWSPDGNSVMVVSFDVNGHLGYYQIDVHSGIAKPFLITKGRNLFGGHGWLPDGNTFFYGLRDSTNREYQLISQNIKSGEKKVLYKSRSQFGISASWDGLFLSILSNHEKSLKVLPVSGDPATELFNSEDVKGFDFEIQGAAMTWSRNGKYIYFPMKVSNDLSDWELCRVSVANQKIDKLGIKTNIQSQFANLNAHPDGKHFSYSSRDKLNSEVWELDNFLPPDKLATSIGENSPTKFTNSKIWEDQDIDDTGKISPDGKYISYTDWDTGELAVFEVSTGKKRLLTKINKGRDYDQFTISSLWSPDSKTIYYTVFVSPVLSELRSIGLFDSDHTTISRIDGKEKWIKVHDLSPDGTKILSTINTLREKTQIALIDVVNGDTEVIKEFGSIFIENLRFLKDQKQIFYNRPYDEDSQNHNIYSLTIDGKHEIPLIDHPAHDFLLGLVKDGSRLLFASNRSGKLSFWSVGLDHGKVIGVPGLIKSSEHNYLKGLGFTTDGAFSYCHFPSKTDVYELELDSESGKIITPPTEIVQSFMGENSAPDYSPDGKYMAFISRRMPFNDRQTFRPVGNVLCIKDLDNGSVKEIIPDLDNFGFPKWSADSRSVVVVNWEDVSEGFFNMGFYKIEVQTGNTIPLKIGDYTKFNNHEFCPDGKSIFVVTDDKKGKLSLLKHDFDDGVETAFVEGSWKDLNNIACSPDGKWVSFIGLDKKRALKIMSTQGGKVRELHTWDQGDNQAIWHCWSADGKYIYLTKLQNPKKDLIWNLWRIPVNGGEPENLGLELTNVWQIRAHPDGKRIAFSNQGSSYKQPEVWLMENFLFQDK